MKRSQIINLFNTLNSFGNQTGVKFSYAVAKNVRSLVSEIEAIKIIEQSLEMTPEMKEFDKLRLELAKKHSKKDDKGEALKVGNNFLFENPDLAEEEFEALKKEYKEVVDARDKQVDEYTKFLEEEVEVHLHKVNLEDVPKEINAQQMNAIFEIIEEV